MRHTFLHKKLAKLGAHAPFCPSRATVSATGPEDVLQLLRNPAPVFLSQITPLQLPPPRVRVLTPIPCNVPRSHAFPPRPRPPRHAPPLTRLRLQQRSGWRHSHHPLAELSIATRLEDVVFSPAPTASLETPRTLEQLSALSLCPVERVCGSPCPCLWVASTYTQMC